MLYMLFKNNVKTGLICLTLVSSFVDIKASHWSYLRCNIVYFPLPKFLSFSFLFVRVSFLAAPEHTGIAGFQRQRCRIGGYIGTALINNGHHTHGNSNGDIKDYFENDLVKGPDRFLIAVYEVGSDYYKFEFIMKTNNPSEIFEYIDALSRVVVKQNLTEPTVMTLRWLHRNKLLIIKN